MIEHLKDSHKDRKVMLQSKDVENNSFIDHVMESEKGFKVSMQLASAAEATVAAASSDRARYVFLFSVCFILLFFTTIILKIKFGDKFIKNKKKCHSIIKKNN